MMLAVWEIGTAVVCLHPVQTLGHGALHAAVDGLHVDVVERLLAAGADPNLRTHVCTYRCMVPLCTTVTHPNPNSLHSPECVCA